MNKLSFFFFFFFFLWFKNYFSKIFIGCIFSNILFLLKNPCPHSIYPTKVKQPIKFPEQIQYTVSSVQARAS